MQRCIWGGFFLRSFPEADRRPRIRTGYRPHADVHGSIPLLFTKLADGAGISPGRNILSGLLLFIPSDKPVADIQSLVCLRAGVPYLSVLEQTAVPQRVHANPTVIHEGDRVFRP